MKFAKVTYTDPISSWPLRCHPWKIRPCDAAFRQNSSTTCYY